MQPGKPVFNKQKYCNVYYRYWMFLYHCTGWPLSHWLSICSAHGITSQRLHPCCLWEQFPDRVLDRAQVSLCLLKVGRTYLLDHRENYMPAVSSRFTDTWGSCVKVMCLADGWENREEEGGGEGSSILSPSSLRGLKSIGASQMSVSVKAGDV